MLLISAMELKKMSRLFRLKFSSIKVHVRKQRAMIMPPYSSFALILMRDSIAMLTRCKGCKYMYTCIMYTLVAYLNACIYVQPCNFSRAFSCIFRALLRHDPTGKKVRLNDWKIEQLNTYATVNIARNAIITIERLYTCSNMQPLSRCKMEVFCKVKNTYTF